MANKYYIASCVFTERHPRLSSAIQKYITERYDMPIVRCCTPKYKLKEFEERMSEQYRDDWRSLPDAAKWQAGDIAISICHNCSNIIEETQSGVTAVSLWELILSDEQFKYPDHSGMKVTVQDCWRSKERYLEQQAVRKLLEKMNIQYDELKYNYSRTEFCGISMYKPQPARNPILAPKYYKDNVEGLFLPHTEAEQEVLMKDYCKQFATKDVVCYCHYCLEGLKAGGVNGILIADLLFES